MRLVIIVHWAQYQCIKLDARQGSTLVVVQRHALIVLPVTIALILLNSQLLALQASIAQFHLFNLPCVRSESLEQNHF